MCEHLLNLDSVFCPILSFGLEDMLFRITLSDGVCLRDVFAGTHSTSSITGWMHTVVWVLFVGVSGSLADTSGGLWNTMSRPNGMYERQAQAPHV